MKNLEYMEAAAHYDLLIDEGNDPVHDPDILKAYMDAWDGPAFIEKMRLTGRESVLEIGVGTGRLAIRTAERALLFTGIDLSLKTVRRAEENLRRFSNVHLIHADFLSHAFSDTFDVIYSSLTFMHIREKKAAVSKIYSLLRPHGRFLLSIDKNPSDVLDMGTRRIRIFPDDPVKTERMIKAAGLHLTERFETESAHIFLSEKG